MNPLSLPKNVGFVIEGWPLPYNYVGASVRLRVYDVIRLLQGTEGISFELYRPWKRYHAVIFQRRDRQAFDLAKRLKGIGTKIVLDVNANLFDKSLYGRGFFKGLSDRYFENFMNFARLADVLVVTSPYLKTVGENLFGSKVVFLPEILNEVFFQQRKSLPKQDGAIRLVYAGYAAKVDQLLLIKNQLEGLAKKYKVIYTLICEKKPHISIPGIDSEYVHFRNSDIHSTLMRGDIFLAPRDLFDPYNLAHSFTKIGLPMSLGIPVIASPVPAYQESPAILLDSFDDRWSHGIEHLVLDNAAYAEQSTKGIDYCQVNFSPGAVRQIYSNFFEQLL